MELLKLLKEALGIKKLEIPDLKSSRTFAVTADICKEFNHKITKGRNHGFFLNFIAYYFLGQGVKCR